MSEVDEGRKEDGRGDGERKGRGRAGSPKRRLFVTRERETIVR